MTSEQATSRREFIAGIRNDYAGDSRRGKNNQQNACERLAQDLYNTKSHFIFELIQNAEDNAYTDGVPPTLRLRVCRIAWSGQHRTVFVVQNNELGFREDQVDALCAIGKSTKRTLLGYIGEKGIGFKSVFQVTDCPHIYSNGFQFCLPKSDPETGLGYIVPKWLDHVPDLVEGAGTTILLPLADNECETVIRGLADIAPETILFLSKLKIIEIEVALPDVSYEIVIEKDDSHAPLVKLTHLKRQQGEEELKTRGYWVAVREFDKPPDIHHEKRPNVNTRPVSVAIPLDDGREHPGKLFAYLPVWERTGLPFLVNADFLLVSSREGIHEDEPWNLWLLDCIAPVYADAFLAIVGNESWPIEQRAQAYASIPTASHQEWLTPVVGEIQEHLRQEACVLTSPDGALAKPGFCRLPTKAWREVLETPDRRPTALGNDFAFVHAAIAGTFAEVLKGIGVKGLLQGDVVACLRDSTWLAEREDAWMVQLYRCLMSSKYESLADLSLVPAVLLGTGERKLYCPRSQPVYFRPDQKGAKALRAIPAWLRKAKPVAFLPKPLQRLIDECDDRLKLRSWMTKELEVYGFTASNYCIDVLDYLQDEGDRIAEEKLIEVTKFLVEHAANTFDWSRLPIVLADGTRMTVAGARNLTWKDGKDGEPVPIQALVVPESYDPERGWQHIWRTVEDRLHFRYLSPCYSKDVAKKLQVRGVVHSAPGFRTTESRWTPYSVTGVRIERIASSALAKPDGRLSEALVQWLLSDPGRRPVPWPGGPGWKSAYSGTRDSDYEWAMDLLYYEQCGRVYKVHTGPYQFKCGYSKIVERLRDAEWLPTTKGLVRPDRAFLPKRETREVLGDTVPYFTEDFPEALLTLFGVKITVTTETLLGRLDACRDDPTMDAKLPERIYRQLASRTPYGGDSELRGKFRDQPLIFLPDRPPGRQWVTTKDCVWRDAQELFGEAFGYLEKTYPRLQDFFVSSLGVKGAVDAECYARRWLQLQDESPATKGCHRQAVAELYGELRQALIRDPRPDWLRDFLGKARVYTQSDTFEDPARVVVPDDGGLKRVFDGEVAFAWRPDHDAFADWQPLYEAVKMRRLSECVKAHLDSPPESAQVPKQRLITPACVQMIASWLREKERAAYERLRDADVFGQLFNIREEQAEASLRVVYTLDLGRGHAPVVKGEEPPVFWDRAGLRLVHGPAEADGGAKPDAARQLTRFLLGSAEAEHDLANWIELTFGESDTRRLEDKNWSVPEEILALSDEHASPKGVDDSDSQAPSSAPSPLAPRPPDAATPPQSGSTSAPWPPASPTSFQRQPALAGSRGGMSSPEPAPRLGPSPVEPAEVAPQPPEYAEMLSEAFNRPGETAIDEDFRGDSDADGNSVRNPERRARKLAEQHRERMANEPNPDERRRTTERTLLEPADPQVRQKLLDWYDGRCQVCGETWPERDGTPFFVAARLVERRHARWLDDPGNAVCLCAEHFAQWRLAAIEEPMPIAEQVRALGLPSQGGREALSIRFRMLGSDVQFAYCEKHFLAVKALFADADEASTGA